jgi:hypothetical protein
LIKSLVEFTLTVLMGALLGDAPDSMWSRRRFRCKFCGGDFDATPDARNWKRAPVVHCHACGYNLTGNTSGTCPECGSEQECP